MTDSASSLPTVHELELGLLLDAIYRCYHLLQGVSRGLVEREDKLQSPPTLAAHLVRAVTPHSRMEHLR